MVLRKGDVVYSSRMDEALYVEQATKEGVYLFRPINKQLKSGKPTVAFSYSGDIHHLKKLDIKRSKGDDYWFGFLTKGKENKRVIVYGSSLYTLLIGNDRGKFTEFPLLTLSEVAYNLDYFIDDLGYDIFIDDDLMDMLWEEYDWGHL